MAAERASQRAMARREREPGTAPESNGPRGLTLTEAKALAERWEAMAEDLRDAASLLSRFSNASPSEVIRMWETGKNEDGRRLTKFEGQALLERWCQLFGCFPPDNDVDPVTVPPTEPLPADDTMMDMHEVLRVTGLSNSTIKRRVDAGRFPAPLHISTRRIAWPARVVREWIEEREAESDRRQADRDRRRG
jgi:prophage regulatory protein